MTQDAVKIDYHLHPNFPFILGRFFCKRKARTLWDQFTKNDLDAVLIAEHVYKRPRTSFEILKKYKPIQAKTVLIPAIEYLTKEGVDVIVFAEKEEDIYSKKDLLHPWKLSLAELVSLVKSNKKMYGMVVHVYTPGATSILKCGKKATENTIRDLGFLEVHNCSFVSLQKLFELLGLSKILKKKYSRMLRTKNAPSSLIFPNVVITGGSDAHHAFEVGDHMLIEVPHEKKLSLFELVTTQSGVMKFGKDKPIYGLVVSMFTVLIEYLMKKLHLYKIDKPKS